ncbi:SH3 domain-containing protein [Salipiger mucosus]|uniref:SH3b domain-containing protein n=1 Tax=Salipiger mucosus DSM 16094 TaxID=1123237 RepID=S9RJP0_9RHOB|nr:SH3 domain-containing protein [Salipiger mucosus]EPX78335.1 hypothetical protein Salmuc_03951 [Salipiger mucosus DSM 16094]
MRGTIFKVLAAGLLTGVLTACSASGGWNGRHEVYGVEEGDMLKLRGGPGTGFDIYTGLPNGTVVQVHECTPTGGTSWCEVSLERARGLRGWVSEAYLREL